MVIIRDRILSKLSLRILVISLTLLLSGCIFTLTNYSATSYEHLTQLKAYHLKFIDDFTTDIVQPIDDNMLAQKESSGDLKFREAISYADGMKDKSRSYNIEQLQGMFNDDVSDLKIKKKTLSKALSSEKKKLCSMAYDLAIKGEIVRNHTTAPTN